MNRPALFANHESYVTWRDFSLDRTCRSTAWVGRGRARGREIWRRHAVHAPDIRGGGHRGFRYGLVLGESAPSVSDASEFTCESCRFSNNDVGATWSGYNTLNIQFIDTDTFGNTRGFEIGGDGTFARQVSAGALIAGGSTGRNTEADFAFGNCFDVTTIRDVRAEPTGYFIEGDTGFLEASGNVISPTRRPDHVGHRIGANGGEVTLRNNAIGGSLVSYTSGEGGWLEMVGNLVREGDPGRPVRLTRLSGSSSGGRVTLRDNRWDGGPQALFADVSGYVSSTNGAATIVPVLSFDEPSAADPNAGLHASRLRSLAFGSTTMGRISAAPSRSRQRNRRVHLHPRGDGDDGGQQPDDRVCRRRADADRYRTGDHDPGREPRLLSRRAWRRRIRTGRSRRCRCEARGRDAVEFRDRDRAVHGPHHRGNVRRTRDRWPDEPDANWYPVGLACTAAEIVYFDPATLTAAGVTFKSSNPTSHATCHFLVRR